MCTWLFSDLSSFKNKRKRKKRKRNEKNVVDLVFLYLNVNQKPRILALITDSDIPYVRCITLHIKKVSIYEKLLAKIFHFRCDFQQKKNWQLKNLRKIKSILPITSALLTPKKKASLDIVDHLNSIKSQTIRVEAGNCIILNVFGRKCNNFLNFFHLGAYRF